MRSGGCVPRARSATGTPVPLAERMCRVQLGVVRGDPLEKALARKSSQVVLVCELVEYSGEVRLDVLGQREHAVVFRDCDGAQLARPLLDVAKDPPVKCPEVGEVVTAGEPRALELGDQDRRLLGLDPRELARITDAGTVPQAARARVDVWVGWQRG